MRSLVENETGVCAFNGDVAQELRVAENDEIAVFNVDRAMKRRFSDVCFDDG